MKNIKNKIIKKITPPTVAIVGRANVGKSTLFNRLLEKPKAMVSPSAGTTRDRNYGRANWRGSELILVDTGGLEDEAPFAEGIKKQVDIAISRADLIVFLVDVKTGIMPQDRLIAKFLLKLGKPVILAGNKADNPELFARADDPQWLKLALGNPLAVSAANGSGTGDLLDVIFKMLKIKPEKENGKNKIAAVPPIKVAIVGKPNAGKSSLLNSLLGEERVLVSETPFTTREPQDTLLLYQDQPLLLIDTVGIRKKSKIERGLEKIGVKRSIAAAEKSDVVLFVTEADKQMTSQDKHLAQLIVEKNSGIIIAANKWDLVTSKGPATPNLFIDYYKKFFPSLGWAPVVFLSAKTGEKVKKLFDMIIFVRKEREKFLSQNELNNFLRQTLAKHWSIIHQRKKAGAGDRPFIKNIEQTGIRPPKFLLTTTSKQKLPEAFVKFIEKRLRENFGFVGTPIKIEVKHIKKI